MCTGWSVVKNGERIMVQTTYTSARDNFAELWDKAIEDREVIIISRLDHEDVALVAASELSSLMETAHLLRSPKNAQRLLSAIARSRAEEGNPQTIDELRTELGL
jgi:antitoxin YefM